MERMLEPVPGIEDEAERTHQDHLPSIQLLPEHSQPILSDGAIPRRDKRTPPPASVNTFIAKTYAILQEKQFESIVSWSEPWGTLGLFPGQAGEADRTEGQAAGRGTAVCSFRIHNLREFQEVVLPRYFKHSNMSSFVRQLNMYSFHKVRGDKNEIEFQHQKFIRNRPDLLHEIRRKQVDSTTSIPSIALIPHPASLDLLREPDFLSLKEIKREYPLESLPDLNESPDKRDSSAAIKSAEQEQLQRLADLQQTNRGLKKLRQQRTAHLKQIGFEAKAQGSDKFNKLMFALLACKLDGQANQAPLCGFSRDGSLGKIHKVIEHVMDCSQVLSFADYLSLSRQLLRGDSQGVGQI